MKQQKEILFGFVEISEIANQDIVIFGTGHASEVLVNLLECPYHLCYYCDNDSNKWGHKKEETEIISPLRLSDFLKENEKCIIIIASVFSFDIKKQLQEELNIKNRIIVFDQLIPIAYEQKYSNMFQKDKKTIGEEIYKKRYSFNKSKLVHEPPDIIIYAAPKVGNRSVNVALGDKPFATTMFSMYHSMDRLRFSEEEKRICASKVKKIIIGVRDAIAQNISMLFQSQDFYCLLFGKDGRDAQKVFQICVEDSICYEQEKRQKGEYGFEQLHHTPFLIQSWFDDVFLKDFNVDIYQFPFDKEKGYSIYENINGYDILIYQLEKLNNLENIFQNFTGYKNFHLKKQNDAEEKWYSAFYKQFKTEVSIMPEYIEKTYTGKMMQHFYSEEDIAVFKNKWKKHSI